MRSKFIVVFLALLSVMGSLANTTPPELDSSTDEETIRLKRDRPGKGPRMPSYDYLEAVYDGNGFTIIPYYTDILSFSVFISTQSQSFNVTLSPENSYYISTGPLRGECYIECTTPTGLKYYGETVLE